VAFGYSPNFGNGRDAETYLWNFGCVAAGIAMVIATLIALFALNSLRKHSVILLVAWFPYMLFSGVFYINLYRNAVYG
jgi:hypothetical protein